MRFLLVSDVHLDAPFAWARPEVARRRRQALRDAFARAVRLAAEEGVDALLVGGDLYEHDSVTPDTEEFLRTLFAEVHPLRVLIAPGNHDWYGPQSVYARVDWTPNVHVFRSKQLDPLTLADGCTLWGAAHCAPAGTAGFLDGFRVDRGGVNLALFHGAERGVGPERDDHGEHAPFDASQIQRAGLAHAFLGHVHRPRDAERYTYPGNPEPLAFGEDGPRGVVLATVARDGSVQRERIDVARTKMHDVTLDVTDCVSREQVRDAVRQRLAGLDGLVRVTLVGEVDPSVDLHRRDFDDLGQGLEGCVVELSKLAVRYDLQRIAQERTVRGEFVREASGAIADPDELRRVLVTGLRALDGRDDLEVE
jgi:DNA repair exonuclease SbcCD nuclease subunit